MQTEGFRDWEEWENMDYSAALKMLDDLIYKKAGIRLLNSEGKVDLLSLTTLLGNNAVNILNSNFQCSSVKLDVKDEPDENVGFEMQDDQLVVSMPKTLQEQITFAVKYIVSEFDKINNDINRLSRQFHIDRIGVIMNAENTLKSVCSENGLSDVSQKTLIACRQDLGNSVEQLSKNIQMVIKDINDIPTDNIKRLFKVKVQSVLNQEKEGRMSVNEYVKGIGIYAEISLKLGQPVWAVNYMENGIDFLRSFEKKELIRVEGWNEQKDRFWDDKIDEYINLLLRWKQRAENYYIIPIEEK